MSQKCNSCKEFYDKELFKCPKCGAIPSDENDIAIDSKQVAKITRTVIRKIIKTTIFWLGLISLIFGIGLWQAYRGATKKLEDLLTNKISTGFKDENIKVMMENVASTESRKLLEQNLAPTINNFKESTTAKVDNFNGHLDELKKGVSKNYNVLKKEVAYLKKRNTILKIADRAILPDGAYSYKQLSIMSYDEKLPDEYKQLVSSQILRIMGHYLGISYIKNVELEITDKNGKTKKNDALSTDEIIGFLNEDRFPYRAKAAQLLSRRKEKKVPDILLDQITKDTDLEVIKWANRSFCNITGFKADGIPYLPPTDHMTWWKENKKKVTASLK